MPMHFQETLNFWKQIPHVMKYFRETENPTAGLPQNFMQSFLEVSCILNNEWLLCKFNMSPLLRAGIDN